MSTPTKISLSDAVRVPYEGLRLSPEWRGFLGDVPASSQFNILVSGPSGTGKSTLCLQLAKEFTRFGDLLYICAEETAMSGTIRKRARILNVSSRRIILYDTKDLQDIERELATGKYRFCFIDSIQEVTASEMDLIGIMDRHPEVAFIFVAQVDWSERFSKGSSSWRHRVDIRIWTYADKEGIRWAENTKNRYAPDVHKLFLFRPKGATGRSQPSKKARGDVSSYDDWKNRQRSIAARKRAR